MIAAAAYHVYVKKVINEVKMSTMDMVLYNNTMSIPLLIVAGLIVDKCVVPRVFGGNQHTHALP